MKKIITDDSVIDEISIEHMNPRFIGFEMGNSDRFIVTKRTLDAYKMNSSEGYIATSLKYLNTGYGLPCKNLTEYVKQMSTFHPSFKFYQCDSLEELIDFGLRKKETYEVHERLLTRDMALYRQRIEKEGKQE